MTTVVFATNAVAFQASDIQWSRAELPRDDHDFGMDGAAAPGGVRLVVGCQDNDRGILFYKSTDGGSTWPQRHVVTSEMHLACHIAAFNVSTYIIVGASLFGYNKVWRSLDGGQTWSNVFSIEGGPAGSGDPSNEGDLLTYGDKAWWCTRYNDPFDSTDHGRIFFTTNKGATWNVGSHGDLFSYCGLATLDGTTVYGSYCDCEDPAPTTAHSVMATKSTDGGATWGNTVVVHYHGQITGVSTRIAVMPNGDVAVAYREAPGMIVKWSMDQGATWGSDETVLGNSIRSRYTFSLVRDENALLIGTGFDGSFVAAVRDPGWTTSSVNTTNGGGKYAFLGVVEHHKYFAGYAEGGGFDPRSTDVLNGQVPQLLPRPPKILGAGS